MSPAELYDEDFYEWTVRNAELLRCGRVSEADLVHIAEEIEDMGKRERREMLSRLAVLMAHLLKWQAQPERRSASWRGTIRVQRRDIGKLLEEMPSLRRFLKDNLPEAYERALTEAAVDTGLTEDVFPSTCPYSLDAILDERVFALTEDGAISPPPHPLQTPHPSRAALRTAAGCRPAGCAASKTSARIRRTWSAIPAASG